MDKFFEELITKTHPAVINLSVIFIILLVAYVIHIWLRSIVTVLEKNVSAQATADNLISLQKEYNGLRDYAISLREAYNQSLIIQAGIKNIHSELKHLFHQFAVGNDIQAQSYGILKTIVDQLSMDLKFSAGETHRCAIWTEIEGNRLGIYVASSSFPAHYRMSRTHNINHSVAGRCYRTLKPDYLPDVDKDKEYLPNPDSSHKIKSMICVPIAVGDIKYGVITIDGKNVDAFKTEDIRIVEIYAEIAAIVGAIQLVNTPSQTTTIEREDDFNEGEEVY